MFSSYRVVEVSNTIIYLTQRIMTHFITAMSTKHVYAMNLNTHRPIASCTASQNFSIPMSV